jgi:hypothetical protein
MDKKERKGSIASTWPARVLKNLLRSTSSVNNQAVLGILAFSSNRVLSCLAFNTTTSRKFRYRYKFLRERDITVQNLKEGSILSSVMTLFLLLNYVHTSLVKSSLFLLSKSSCDIPADNLIQYENLILLLMQYRPFRLKICDLFMREELEVDNDV